MFLPDTLAHVATALGRRYSVERELGRGGMGTVYLALDRKHSRRVAIKILPPELAAALGPERFLREIRIAAGLSHPHILPLHDSGHAAGMLYYVMPHVDGQSLRQRLTRDGRLPVADALDLARQIADALSHAHAEGIIHRDVKPENILLDGRHAFLADFGVAKALTVSGDRAEGHPPELRTDSGLPVGTAAYASPEQAAGSRQLDGRTDLYSLGCVLYEMLVGNLSEGGAPASRILERRFAVAPPPARTFRVEVPPWVDRLLARAMAGNPADRYRDAGELRDALAGPAAETAGTEVSGVAGPAGGGLPLGPRRWQLLWMGAGAAILAVGGSAVAFLPGRRADTNPRRVVVAGFENRTGDTALAPVGDIASDYIARGIAATRLLQDVYDVRTASDESGQPLHVGMAAGQALARRVGAATVLWGSYYREGDSLHFEAQLVDAPTGKVLAALEPAVGLVRERTRVVETLRQRVMAGFSVVVGSQFDTWKAASLPPTYEAYQEMLAGGSQGFDFAAAAEHYRRAAALDTNFTGAQTAAAVALSLTGDCAAVDSIARRVDARQAPLPPVDRGQLRLATAGCQGDTDAAMAATRTALEASPRSVELAVLGAVIAVENLRPRAALEMLRLVDPETIGVKGFLLNVYRDWLGYAYHMLGDYRRELEARKGGAAALAALGRADEAERRAVEPLAGTHPDDDVWPLPMSSECVALELRAHGHPAAAQRIFERVIAWYGADAVNAATRDDFPCSGAHLSAFYHTGRWEEARAGYEHRLASDSMDRKAHAALGALAVRRGDRAEAERMDAWLAARTSDPLAAYARARMAALRGEREGAVDLVRRAFELGLRGRMFLHLDPDFESLRDYAPYRELIRPKP
jgi:tetratricopeptide (TPR) repeat protein